MKNNIKFNYLYRDAGNYKTPGSVIFSNPNKLKPEAIEQIIRRNLIDSEFFEPQKIAVPHLQHLNFPNDPELDHGWNEFNSVEETIDSATDDRTITKFLEVLERYRGEQA